MLTTLIFAWPSVTNTQFFLSGNFTLVLQSEKLFQRTFLYLFRLVENSSLVKTLSSGNLQDLLQKRRYTLTWFQRAYAIVSILWTESNFSSLPTIT